MRYARTLTTAGCAVMQSIAVGAPITTDSLLDEMTDLKRLAEFPDPAYTCKQFSSWDRESTGPSDLKTWFANRDAGQFLRTEDKDGRKEWVMADVDGPGAIVRIWSANPGGGNTIRIYLDGSDKPAIECSMEQLLGGKYKNLVRPLAGEYSKGWNLYFPIPYAKHLKVTGDKKDFYYHVNYRTYAAGTDVTTFALGDLDRLADKIAQVAAALNHPSTAAEPPASSEKATFETRLAPGDEKALVQLEGSKAICGLHLRPNPENLPVTCRGVVLTMEFDGQTTVECPLGDFFGTAPGLIPYDSLPLGVTEGRTMYGWSHWWMPFHESAVIRVKNWSGQRVDISGAVAVVPYKWADRSLYFNARWRIERDIPTRPFIDWTHLDVEGKGRFVGGHLHFINPVKGWWGEGDEKIFVDGEKFPSTFGTGSEDYYGYAWGNPLRFIHAYHNQPHVDGPGTYGNVSNNRWHILDDIPFTTRFKFDMEQWEWAENQKCTRAAVTYWYARPGGKDQFKPITKDDVKFIDVPPYQVKHVPGAIEAESMKVVEKSAGDTHKQDVGEAFSGEAMLRWEPVKPGDRLTLAFESPEAGRKRVSVHLVRAREFSQVQLYVNDEKAGPVTDLFAQRGTPGVLLELGELDLKRGANQLTLEVTGRSENAKGTPAIGVDYVMLK